MTRVGVFTVTDYNFFPGTLATVSSVLQFHPEMPLWVVVNGKCPCTEPQLACFAGLEQVRVLDSRKFEQTGRYINAWELKAYSCEDLSRDLDVVIGIDSDCLLCSRIDGEIERCFQSGGWMGGRDGNGMDYDASYAEYGIEAPARNSKYMSTSLFLCAVNETNLRSLRRWSECCSRAEFNGQGPYRGHGDQGVLNAVLFADGQTDRISLLENELWSQHWAYWDSIIDHGEEGFLNRSYGGRAQRSFHCGGAEKFWTREHRDRVLDGNALQTYPYVWFLAMLWFGRCRNWQVDPYQYLPPQSHHLIEDLVNFFPQLSQIYPDSRRLWNQLSDVLIDRILAGIPRALSLGGGSMSEIISLVSANRGIRRYVEVGSYEGGSIMALATRFLNRDIDFFSVESFMGGMDGTMDGWRLPRRKAFLDNLARLPALRVQLIPGDSGKAASLFDDSSVDCVFIDACHETGAVLRDIDRWKPKLGSGGIIAGDDYGWESVRRAVDQRFSNVTVTPSGCVWWTRL